MRQRPKTKYMISAIPILIFILLIAFSTAYGQTKTVKQQSPAKSLPLLIDIGAKQCIPCKMMAPILEDLQKNYSDSVKVEFIDVWENQNAGQKYGIRAIPTQIFYNASGKELYRHMGFASKEQIIGAFKELGIEIKKNQEKKK
jgi:thioredoxin 1